MFYNFKYFGFRRKIQLDEKNPFHSSPSRIPLVKINQASKNQSKNSEDQSLIFVNVTPILTGFARTFKSICIASNDDYVIAKDADNDASMINASTLNPFLPANEFKKEQKRL